MKIRIAWDEEQPGLFEGMHAQNGWIICDGCGEPILNRKLGIATFSPHEDYPADVEVSFYHKTTCDKGGITWCELEAFLWKLSNAPETKDTSV